VGTSIKALRVYEKAGLLTPDRRDGGWRLYGPAHIARLHQILALKALGLSLKQIADALDCDGAAIRQIMDLQARHLASVVRTARTQLRRVQHARDRLRRDGEIPVDVLLELTRDLAPPAAMELDDVRAAILAAVRDEDEEAAVRALIDQPVVDSRMEAKIGSLLNEAVIAATEENNESDHARALADRWIALASAVEVPAIGTVNATALGNLAARMAADPALADALTFLKTAVERRTASLLKG
jgi:DNA-binding transcriptional MerR regulator